MFHLSYPPAPVNCSVAPFNFCFVVEWRQPAPILSPCFVACRLQGTDGKLTSHLWPLPLTTVRKPALNQWLHELMRPACKHDTWQPALSAIVAEYFILLEDMQTCELDFDFKLRESGEVEV